jgi:hypothetical protein
MKTFIAIAFAIVAAIGSLSAFNRHAVWERAATDRLMWSDQEAYLFVARHREGWSGNLLELAWEYARGHLGLSGHLTHRRTWLEVTKITRAGLTRTVLPDTQTFPLGVYEDQIYAVHNGSLSKWVNDTFIPVSNDEKSRIHRGIKGGEFRDVNGWSAVVKLLGRGQGEWTYPLVLDGARVVVLASHDRNRLSVFIQFPDQAPSAVLDFESKWTWVDEPSYQRSFSAAAVP